MLQCSLKAKLGFLQHSLKPLVVSAGRVQTHSRTSASLEARMRFAALHRVPGAVASWAKRRLRRQAAAATLENEAFYSSLVATMQQVVFQIDREGRFTSPSRR